MSQFPDEAHLSSWAGMCPGNNESAGVKKSGKVRKGNGFLKGILTEVAWAVLEPKALFIAQSIMALPKAWKVVDSISHMSVQRLLKKMKLNLG
jgi:transposase